MVLAYYGFFIAPIVIGIVWIILFKRVVALFGPFWALISGTLACLATLIFLFSVLYRFMLRVVVAVAPDSGGREYGTEATLYGFYFFVIIALHLVLAIRARKSLSALKQLGAALTMLTFSLITINGIIPIVMYIAGAIESNVSVLYVPLSQVQQYIPHGWLANDPSKIEELGDFNGDGVPDIDLYVTQNGTTATTELILLSNTSAGGYTTVFNSHLSQYDTSIFNPVWVGGDDKWVIDLEEELPDQAEQRQRKIQIYFSCAQQKGCSDLYLDSARYSYFQEDASVAYDDQFHYFHIPTDAAEKIRYSTFNLDTFLKTHTKRIAYKPKPDVWTYHP